MIKYKDELSRAMEFLATLHNSVFLGQAVAVAGTAMRDTLINVPEQKLIEMPVEEDFQMGVSIGLAMNGALPISIFPRWNFLLLATNQIVNHLDKLAEMSQLSCPPKVIIRTGIGSINPLHPGPQHTGDFTDAFKLMCKNIDIVRLDKAEDIFDTYVKAANRSDGVSSLIIEWSDKYHE
jgi:pyruvate/2-oxoglutarate/acetoin dehydrogenase E1 component